MTPTPIIGYITQCKICGEAITKPSPALDIPLTGPVGTRGQKLVELCFAHLVKKHKALFSQGQQFMMEFQVFAALTSFEFGDPSIQPRLELTRAAVFSQVRKNSFTDAAIAQMVATWELEPVDAERVEAGMEAIRDACCEMGAFAPNTEPAGKIIIPA